MSRVKICRYIQSKYREFTKTLIPLLNRPSYKKFKKEFEFLSSISDPAILPCNELKQINYLNKQDLEKIIKQFSGDYNAPADDPFELLDHVVAIWHCYCFNKIHTYAMAFALSEIMDVVTIYISKTSDFILRHEKEKQLFKSRKELETENYNWTVECYKELERKGELANKDYTVATDIKKMIKLNYNQVVHKDTIVKDIRAYRLEKEKKSSKNES
jgi:hypothetical protein